MKLRIFIFFIVLSNLIGQNPGIIQRNFQNGIDGIKSTVFEKPARNLLLAGGIGVAIAYQFDSDVQDWFLEKQPLPESVNRFGDHYGNLYSGIIALTVSGISAYKTNSLNKFEYAFATLSANGLTTVILKEVVGRERPNGANHRSFPSGHTSHSFATATIFKESFGWKLGAPAYCLATITAMNRIQDNKHYLSDVVFGASLGTAFGIGFSQVYLKQHKKLDLSYNWVKSEMQITIRF